ncbi:hypothetical protein [Rathayibacter soli]|uniref:hypothetical protein n=1 Tax=Rathayibacter soli TaxID=3144168 RepID=UPI0027E55637|nr:hypothetical protein [Glaciibacter superstes]
MSFEINLEAFDHIAKRMEDAINGACEVVAIEYPGDSYDVVRAALVAELGTRFERGTGADEVAINDLARVIVERARS